MACRRPRSGARCSHPGWTCLGLINHLAVDDERYWFRGVAAGEPIEFPVADDTGWLVGPRGGGRRCLRPLPR